MRNYTLKRQKFFLCVFENFVHCILIILISLLHLFPDHLISIQLCVVIFKNLSHSIGVDTACVVPNCAIKFEQNGGI